MSDRNPTLDNGVSADTAERMDYDPDNPATWDAPWSIENDAVADWALRKLAAARQEQERLEQRAAEEIASTKKWLAHESKRPQRDIDFFEGHLNAYHRSKRPEGDRYPLRHGTLTSRKGSTVVEVDDLDLFVDWTEGADIPDLVKYDPEPKKVDIRKRLTEAAAVVSALIGFPVEPAVPGVRLVENERSWKVETTSEEQPAWIPAPSESVVPGETTEASAA